MYKSERQRLLNIALEVYQQTDITLIGLNKVFHLSTALISSFLKEHGIEIRGNHNPCSTTWDQAVDMFSSKTVSEIAETLNIDESVLEKLYDNRTHSTNELLDLIAKEYSDTLEEERSITKLARKYGLKHSTIVEGLKKRGVTVTKGRGYILPRNSYVFDVIDTEEKAYWLGFLYSDGTVATAGHSVSISLSIKDIDHLQKFMDFLDYKGKICITKAKMYSKDTSDRISYIASATITDARIHDALIAKGCVPNKTLVLKFPDESIFADKNLIYAFLRGYVEGDGTLGVYPHSKKVPKLEASLMMVGTKPFLEGVQKYLGPGFLMQKPNCGKLVHRLGYSTAKAVRAADLIYKDATVYLERKHNIYITKFAALKSGKNGES